ncbi:FAD/NAD(P)-binding domain-containing protein [Hymenopellis radicata]|nr:FAD/NAD(P)-binding domain-containing protein [Hymenopellis radicata]
MPGIPGYHNRPKQAALPIDFVIVGGGITGFSTAIALRRVGHRVLVLEKDEDVNQACGSGACRMPPNLSKILYHWGLTDEVRAIGEVSGAINIYLQETGELLGNHVWDEEVLRETRGEFVFAHINDLRRLFYETALVVGAEIRLGSTVETVDTAAGTATLSDGTILQGDVILGCDGLHGVTRQILMEANEEEEGAPTIDLSMYRYVSLCIYLREFMLYPGSVTVPKSLILNDPMLEHVYESDTPTLLTWFGNQHAVLGFPLGGKSPSFGMYVYGPRDPAEGTWNDRAPVAGLSTMLQYSEPKLRRLGELVSEATCACVSVDGRPPLEEWVDNRMAVMGAAVHSMPPGSIQDCALTVEDGAVLAKLFSHLHSKDQIQSFLYAFQDLRQPRCASVYAKEVGIVQYMVVPPGTFNRCATTPCARSVTRAWAF